MGNLGNTLGHLKALRRRFEQLLAAAEAGSSPPRDAQAAPLREFRAFGSNPGNLRMRVYIPERLPSRPALVVALHGCTQTADAYDRGCGWSTRADRDGFVVLYPQQQPANNPKNCFSWFLPGDVVRDRGEALSIQQMVEHAIVTLAIDRRKVFITGLSAGGAMTSVMLATYPDIFAGGAIIAGLPYGCASSVKEAFEAMFTEQLASPPALGDRVRMASKHRGPWPKISVWHGTADAIVKASNAENIVRQWVDVHGLGAGPSFEEDIAGHRRRVWHDATGAMAIEAFSISGMAHGVPIAAGQPASCGTAGPFFLDVGISSTDRIAKFWGLGDDAATPDLVAKRPASAHSAAATAIPLSAQSRVEAAQSSVTFGETRTGGGSDPNAVIAAAFELAGLPIPKLPPQPPGAATRVAPGPIIEAALKAARLFT